MALQPLITDDAGTLGGGSSQLEVSFNRDRTRSDGETERARAVPVTYSYGLTETVDIYAGIEHLRVRNPDDRVSGFGNTTIGAKWRFFENEASGTSLAIKPEVAIPVSSRREDDGLGTGKISGSLTFILSQELPFGSIHFNAGIGRDRFRHLHVDLEDDEEEGEDARHHASTRHFSVAPVWEVSEQWQLALDVGIDRSRSGGHTERSKYAEIGAIYTPHKDVDLALGFIRTTDDEHPKSTTHGVTVGLTWRF
ncbi:MAG: transporter [Candidatus Accumulibacter sp.]|nr:transporter [Accumulibacter sp.]